MNGHSRDKRPTRIEEAIAEYDEAIRLNHRFLEAYVIRAMDYTLMGKDTEAQQDVARAVELGFDRTLLKRGPPILVGPPKG